jgi:hypothetical protein
MVAVGTTMQVMPASQLIQDVLNRSPESRLSGADGKTKRLSMVDMLMGLDLKTFQRCCM